MYNEYPKKLCVRTAISASVAIANSTLPIGTKVNVDYLPETNMSVLASGMLKKLNVGYALAFITAMISRRGKSNSKALF